MAALTIIRTCHYVLPLMRVISELPRPITTKLSHTLRSLCDSRNSVRNLGGPSSKIWGLKHEYSGPEVEQLPDLKANNFGMEQDVVSRKSALKAADTPLDGARWQYILVYCGRQSGRPSVSGVNSKLGITVVRPSLQSAPEPPALDPPPVSKHVRQICDNL